LFASDPLPELNPEVNGQFDPEPGVVAERVTYGTQFGMRVPAILYRPKTYNGKLPALIVVNGHGGDKYSWYAFYSAVFTHAPAEWSSPTIRSAKASGIPSASPARAPTTNLSRRRKWAAACRV